MSPATVVSFAFRLLLVASTVGLVACGGDAAGPEKPNPAGVADTIVFSFETMEVVIGDTARLGFTARDVNGAVVPGVTVTWRSLNPTVATVSADGLVTTIDIGEAEIEVEATVPGSFAIAIDSARVGGTSFRLARGSARIFSIPIVQITPSSVTKGPTEAQQFTARITNKNDIQLRNQPETRWSSSNPAVATISASGLATTIKAGTTKITATVTVGSSWSAKQTATLTVSDLLCGGINLVETLNGIVSYKYVAAGTLQGGGVLIGSEYNGSVTSKMTSLGWDPGVTTVVWVGPLTGSASQTETWREGTKITQRLDGQGAPITDVSKGALSRMVVIVDLMTCTYRAEVNVAVFTTHTYTDGQSPPPGPAHSADVFIGGGKPLSTGAGSPFPIAVEVEFPGTLISVPLAPPQNKDALVPYGFAATLIRDSQGPVGKAEVSYGISVVKP